MPASFTIHRQQIRSILEAWGMETGKAGITAEIMADADLRAIDSHGLSMLTVYEELWRDGRVTLNAEPEIVRENAVTALVDAHAGLGYVPSVFAMNLAIRKADVHGMGAVAVRNSAHHGAMQWYVRMATAHGMIGMCCTTTSNRCATPTFGKQAKFGTDPWAFAAPTGTDEPFVLDMATTTIAQGRVRNRLNEGTECPPGWVLDGEAQPSTDPKWGCANGGGFITTLGGSPDGASHKGYGLAAMVQILAAGLSGALISDTPERDRRPGHMDIGHFFMAINPGVFRDKFEFQQVVHDFCADLRATAPIDPARPVMVPGDPERIAAAARLQTGIPVGPGLLAKVQAIAERAGVPFLLS